MKPKPLSSLNHFTVPVAIAVPPLTVLRHADDAGQLLRTARTAFSLSGRPARACMLSERKTSRKPRRSLTPVITASRSREVTPGQPAGLLGCAPHGGLPILEPKSAGSRGGATAWSI